MSHVTPGGGFVVDTKEDLAFFHLLQLRGALRLEMTGLKHSSGRSVYAYIKRTFGFKGSKASVLALLEAHIKGKEAERNATQAGNG